MTDDALLTKVPREYFFKNTSKEFEHDTKWLALKNVVDDIFSKKRGPYYSGELRMQAESLQLQLNERGVDAIIKRLQIEKLYLYWEKNKDAVDDVPENVEFSNPIVSPDDRNSDRSSTLINTKRVVVLSSAALLDSVVQYREKVRGDNFLHGKYPEYAKELLEFLQILETNLELLIADIPITDHSLPTQENNEIELWGSRFWPLVKTEFEKYTSPENMAKSAVPAAIVLGASTLGLLIGGGAVGAGAGAFIGNTIVGHAKPKELSDKIEKALTSDDTPDQ